MATKYINPDPAGVGDDANDGSQWADGGGTVGPWKTIKGGATAARVAPGDIIHIAKSPAPTSLGSCVFTQYQDHFDLAAAVTTKIDDGEAAWTASANVTATADATGYRQGTKASKLVIAVGFTTGLVAYKAIAEANLSARQQLSLWVRCSATTAAGVFQVKLCSDVAGATPVDSFDMPALYANTWVPVAVDKGSALGASIKSVAVYAASDPGAVTVYTDWIMACKAPGDDALTLRSLVSDDNTEPTAVWYPIYYIDGVSVYFAPAPGGYFMGASGTKTGYKREPWLLAPGVSEGIYQLNEAGTAAAPVTVKGGYNTADDTQDGSTWLAGLGAQFGHYFGSSQAYTKWERCCVAHCAAGINTLATGADVHLDSCHVAGCTIGLDNYVLRDGTLKDCNIVGSYGAPLDAPTAFSQRLVLDGCKVYNGFNDASLDSYLGAVLRNCEFRRLNIAQNASTAGGVSGGNAGMRARFYNCIFSHAGSADGSYDFMAQSNGSNVVEFFNSLFASANEIGHAANSLIRSIKHNQQADVHKSWVFEDTWDSDAAVRHTASGISWKATLSGAYFWPMSPSRFPVAVVPCAANAAVTVSAWLRRTHADLVTSLVCPGGQIAGVASDVSQAMTAAADTWEERTITFTPTEAGVVEIELQCYGGVYSAYIDDLTVSQA